MKKQIIAHWIENWTLTEIADKHDVNVQYVVDAIRELWL